MKSEKEKKDNLQLQIGTPLSGPRGNLAHETDGKEVFQKRVITHH